MDIKPIKPFEPIMAEDIPFGEEWISELLSRVFLLL